MSVEEIKYSTEVAGGGYLDPITGSYYKTKSGAEQAQAQTRGLSTYWTVEGAGQVFKSKEEAEAYAVARAPTVWTVEGVDQKFQTKEEAQAYVNAQRRQDVAQQPSAEDWLVSPAGQAYLHSDQYTIDIERSQQPYVAVQQAYLQSDQYTKDVERYQEPWVAEQQAKVVALTQEEEVARRQSEAEFMLPTRESFFVDAPGQEAYAAGVVMGLPQPTYAGISGPGLIDKALEAGATRIAEFGTGIGAASEKAKLEGKSIEAGAMFGAAVGVGVGAAVFDMATFPLRPKAWAQTAAFGAALVSNPLGTAGAIATDFWSSPAYKLGYWGTNVAMGIHAGAGLVERFRTPKVGAVEVKGISLERVGTKTVDWDLSFRPVEENLPALREGMMTGTPNTGTRMVPDVEFGTQTDIFRVKVETQPFKGEVPRGLLENPDILVGVLKETEGGVTLERTAIFKGIEYGKIKAGKPFISDEVMFASFEKPTVKAPGVVTELKGYGDLGSVEVVPETRILEAGDIFGVKSGKADIIKASEYRVDLEFGTKMVDVTGPKVVQPAEWTLKMFGEEPGIAQGKPAVIDWEAARGKIEVPTVTSKIVRTSDLGVDVNAEVAPLMGEAFKVDVKGFTQSLPPEPPTTFIKPTGVKTSWGRMDLKAWRSEIPFVVEEAAKVGAVKPPTVPTIGAPSGGPGGASMLTVAESTAVSPIIITYPQPPITSVNLIPFSAFKTPTIETVSPNYPTLDLNPPIMRLGEPSKLRIVAPPRMETSPNVIPKSIPILEPPIFKQDIDLPPITILKSREDITPKLVDIPVTKQPTKEKEKQIQLPAFKWTPPPTNARPAFGLLPPPGFGGGGFGGKTRYKKRLQRVPLPTIKDIMRRLKI